MIRNVIKNLINVITKDDYSDEEKEQMEYLLTLMSFELVKIIFILIISLFLGYFKEVILILATLCFTKPFIGGYHEDSQIKCLIATLLLIIGVLILSVQCKITFISNCVLLFISIFSIWHKAPIINPKMPITRPELIKKNRNIGICIATIFGITSIIIYKYSNYYSLITWTILFNSILMFNKREI